MKKLVAVLLTFFLFLTGCTVEKIEDDIETDGIKFSKEYPVVSEDNLYEYTNYQNVYDLIENGTGVVYLGFPECDSCDVVVDVLNEVAKEKEVEKIYYYDFKEIKENNTDEYKELVKLLSDYINQDDNGEKIITAPTVIFINEGTIVGVYTNTINSDEKKIITDEEKEKVKSNFSSMIDNVLKEETTEGKTGN